jgi:hypothetical protein
LTGAPVFPRPEIPLSARQLSVIADAAVAAKRIVDFQSWQRWKRIWSQARPTVAERQARLADTEWRTRYYGDTAVQYKTFEGRRQEL